MFAIAETVDASTVGGSAYSAAAQSIIDLPEGKLAVLAPVPTGQVTSELRKLRNAAKELGSGLRLVASVVNAEAGTTVLTIGKGEIQTRAARKPKPAEAPVETAADKPAKPAKA